MKKILPIYLFLIVSIGGHITAQTKTYKLSFRITDEQTAQGIENAQISITPCSCGGITDENGNLALELSENTYTITVSNIGYEQYRQRIVLNRGVLLEIALSEQEQQLSEVVVKAKKVNDNIESPQMGVVQLKAPELKKLPMALGEFDVLRSMTLVAGVNNAGDVSNGLSVRGGSLDQNLLLYEYAPIFNPTHLFGLISVFTPEAVSNVDLYRANIPSRYGGRIASVLDVKVKNPYVNKFKLSGGVGLLSSRLSVETPLVKDKLMLYAGVRGGFTDFLLPIFSERLKNTKARFADGTVKLIYLPTEDDQVSFTGFYSKDFYQLDLISQIENVSSETNQYDFGILNGTLKWTHSFSENANLKTILLGSDYTPKIIFPEIDSENEIEFESVINYLSLISEFSKQVNDNWDYYIGVQGNRYKISPGSLDPGTATDITSVTLSDETSYELSGYANLNWTPIPSLSLSGGLRYNHFTLVGPYTLATFDDIDGSITNREVFGKGDAVKTYTGLEPRLGVSFALDENTSLKASYARVNQYLQNIYNSTTPLPTSRWKVSDPNIKPQTGDTYGLGIYQNLDGNSIELGLEGYYRDTKNVLTYKPGADFFLEEFVEQDIVQGEGQAYGVELSFRKPTGNVNGWFNYTWSRSLLRSVNERVADRINNNNWFASDFDRPHVFNGTINFEKDKYNTVSFNFTAQTGRPFTAPNATVDVDGITVPIFLERNNARLPLYHRLDFSWNVHFSKSKKNKRWQNDWTFTIYNVYGRRNPINTYYTQRIDFAENSEIFRGSPLGAYEIALLNSPLISLTYNFKFQ
ncbi:MAG: TonB-dependent receptor [Bacteroidota bacterium]